MDIYNIPTFSRPVAVIKIASPSTTKRKYDNMYDTQI